MPKIKTHKSAAKRFKISGSGKILRNKAYRRHLLTHKSRKNKRRLKAQPVLFSGDVFRIKRLLPYS
ncbi:MAG: 50S ribosomal protein L35 [Brevinematia bacterium]